MLRAWPAHGSWSTASSPAGGAVERIWPGPPMTNQVRAFLSFPSAGTCHLLYGPREWCCDEAADPVCGVGTETAGIHFPCIPPIIPLYFRARGHDSLQRYVRLMWRLSGVKSGYNKCNNCKQLVNCVQQWLQHTHSAGWTRRHHEELHSFVSPVCVQGRMCPTAGMKRSNSTTLTVLDSPLAQVRFSSDHLHVIT